MRTFRKGVHPAGKKAISGDFEIREMPAPLNIAVPLQQHIGAPAEGIVSAGDYVKRGQLIGKAAGDFSANIFSPVSGRVVTTAQRIDPNGNKTLHVIIENDRQGDAVFLPRLENPSGEEVLARIRDAGIVGMGGAGFPTHIKFMPKKPVDTFIINAAECEPYITCDYRIMLEYTEQFLRGAKLLAHALGLSTVYIGIENNKPAAVAALKEVSEKLSMSDITPVVLKTKYPQGAEKQLIYSVSGRKVPHGGLPADVGVVVSNVHTALSTYYAVAEGEPLYRRVLTVSGGSAVQPANLWVSNGTSFRDVIDFCGGERDDAPVFKLINGGPMMGKAVANEFVHTTKTSSCILMMSRAECEDYTTLPCINCARCAKCCPMNLMPMYIDRDCLAGDFEGANKYGAPACIECGCCSYVCPAKRPLVQSVVLAKKTIRERKL